MNSAGNPAGKGYQIMARKVCFELATLALPIKLEQTGKDSFTTTYGLEVKSGLTYAQAASSLGGVIMHALACEGKLDNRMKGES